MSNTVTGIVTRVERTGHTYYGNPIHVIYVECAEDSEGAESGVYRISDNASLNYEISNPVFRNEPHTFALTRAGRISHLVYERCTVCGVAQASRSHDLYCPKAV